MVSVNRQSIAIVAAFTGLMFLFLVFRSMILGLDIVHASARIMPIAIVGFVAALTGIWILSLLRAARTWQKIVLVLIVSVPSAALSALVGNTLVFAVDRWIAGACDSIYCSEAGSPAMLLEAITGNVFIYASQFLILLWMRSIDNARLAERIAADARDAARIAQLRALRYQVNPHFLFNCLNSLATLVDRGDRPTALGMIREMSGFLRYGLSADPVADVDLDDEIEMQRRYLEIERHRFAHRMIVLVDVADDVRRARLPALILQPLVENAVKHGVASTSAAVTVKIQAGRRGPGWIEIEVADDAPHDIGSVGGLGIGLRNVAERLKARFGDEAALVTAVQPGGGFRAALTLPLVRA